jgi:DNA-binding transcriptional LysR family regulator
MDFDQLHTFLEIVRLKSFSKAAQTCFRTQPAISAQIRQMEQELGTQLFERFGSRISLTTAGKIFAEHAQQLQDMRRQAFDAVRELDRVPRGEVVIAANEATCIHVLPDVFATFTERFPEVQLQVIRSYGAQTVQSVLDNSVDFGFTQLPVQEKRLTAVQFHTDEIRLMVPPKHALAKLDAVSPDNVVSYPLLLPKGGRTRSRLNEFLEIVESEIRISMELDSSEMLKQFIISDLGIGFVAVSTAKNEVREGLLKSIPLAPLPMVRNLGLIYRKDKPLSRAALGFIELVADFAKNRNKEKKEAEAAAPAGGGKAAKVS